MIIYMTRKNIIKHKKTRYNKLKLKGGASINANNGNLNEGNLNEGNVVEEPQRNTGSYFPQPQMGTFIPQQFMPPQFMPQQFMPPQMGSYGPGPQFMPQQFMPQQIPVYGPGPYFMPPQFMHQQFMPPQMPVYGPGSYFMPPQMPMYRPPGPYFMTPQMGSFMPPQSMPLQSMPPQMGSYEEELPNENNQSFESTASIRPASTNNARTSKNNRPASKNNRPASANKKSAAANITRRNNSPLPTSPPAFFHQDTISNRFLNNIKTGEEKTIYLEKIFMDRFKDIKKILNDLGYMYIKFRHIKPKPTGIYISWTGFTSTENYENHKTLTTNNVGFDNDIITISIHETNTALSLTNYQSYQVGKMHVHFWKTRPPSEQKYVRLLLINTGEILFDKHIDLTDEETKLLQIMIETLSIYIKTHMFVPVQAVQAVPTMNMFPSLESSSAAAVKPRKVKPVPVRPVPVRPGKP